MTTLTTEQANELLTTQFAPWVLDLNLTVQENTQNSATLLMQFSESLNRQGGIVSGQALMALADTAMVIALFSAHGEFRPMATVSMNTHFLRAAANSSIRAEAKVIKLGRSMAFTAVDLFMESNDKLVSNVQGTYVLVS